MEYSTLLILTCCNLASATTELIPNTVGTGGIEVGSGNLKLIYSGKDGKLMKYINLRNSVSHLEKVNVFFMSSAFNLVICSRSKSNITTVHY